MAVKKTKKVNPKDIAKTEVMAIIEKALLENGYTIADGTEYGMTKGTVIANHKLADVQIKPIAPKAGLDRYEVVTEE